MAGFRSFRGTFRHFTGILSTFVPLFHSCGPHAGVSTSSPTPLKLESREASCAHTQPMIESSFFFGHNILQCWCNHSIHSICSTTEDANSDPNVVDEYVLVRSHSLLGFCIYIILLLLHLLCSTLTFAPRLIHNLPRNIFMHPSLLHNLTLAPAYS